MNSKVKSVFKTLATIVLIFFLLPSGQIRGEENFKPVVVTEHGFEDYDDCGWVPRGGAGEVFATEDAARSGSGCLTIEGRSLDWHMARVELTEYMKKGAKYAIELYVKLPEGVETAPFNLTMLTRVGTTDTEVTLDEVIASSKEWVKLGGEYIMEPTTTGSFLYVYFRGDPKANYYIDDFKLTQLTPAVDAESIPEQNLEFTFEEGKTDGWGPRGEGVKVEVVKDTAISGEYSLKTTNRSQHWHGASLNLKDIIQPGVIYEVGGYLKLIEEPTTPATIRLTMEQQPVGKDTSWVMLAQQNVSDTQWVKLAGQYAFSEKMDVLNLYFESTNPDDSFYIDDIYIKTYVEKDPEEIIEEDLLALKDVFADYFSIGAAVEPGQLTKPEGKLLKKHYNVIVAENVMKPGSLQPLEGVFTWRGADAIIRFAEMNEMKVRFHTLVWHQQTKDWFFLDEDGNDMTLEKDPVKREANKELILKRLEKHITRVVERYKDQIEYWDVVNEVIDPAGPGGLRDSKWYQITGKDYIETAFRTVRKVAGPDAKLYINDYSTQQPARRDALYRLVKELLDKGVPIDGVGHQMHLNIEEPSIELIRESIKLFGELGLDNQITELDVSIYTDNTESYPKVPQELLVRQGYRYKELFDEFRALKDYISNVTFWGIADNHSWLHNRPIPRQDAPFAFDEEFQAKPAYWGMVDPSNLPIITEKLNVFQGKPVIDGDEDSAWLRGTLWTKVNYGNGPSGAFKLMWEKRRFLMFDKSCLYLLVDVKDTTFNAQDLVELYIDQNNEKTDSYQKDDLHFIFKRSGERVKGVTYKVKEYEGGYRLEAVIPLQGLSDGKELGVDLRFTDIDQEMALTSWNDLTHSQDTDTSKYGTVTLKN